MAARQATGQLPITRRYVDFAVVPFGFPRPSGWSPPGGMAVFRGLRRAGRPVPQLHIR